MNMDPGPAAMRVMLVEDSVMLRERMRGLIEHFCPAKVVAEAGTLVGALAALREQSPDAVVLDLHLPDGSGLDVLRTVKDTCAACVVIVLTSFALPDIRETCRALGADFFFDKTLEFERVLDVLRERAALSEGGVE